MENSYCMGCMRKKPPGETVCPDCGYKHEVSANPDFALPAGTQLLWGKYLIGKVLGRGGFGITYLGLDTTLGLKVAVKECFPTNMATRVTDTHGLTWAPTVVNVASIQRIFTNEARKIARMEEVYGIVKVREVFEENNTEYIVMGYIEGETLRERMRRTGPMDPETCLNLLRPIMTALSAAHHMNMIHRDISPDNIMIRSSDRSVWLLDLGAAKDMEGSVMGPDVAQSTHLIVRNGYSPWEQYSKKEEIGPWTDVYALCATAYYCMTGETPPPVIDRAGQDEIAIPEEVPAPVAAVLRKGLALYGRNRQQSMNELLMEFEAGVKEWKRKGKERPRSGSGKWIAAVLIMAVLIGAGFWWWRQSRGEPGLITNGQEENVSGTDGETINPSGETADTEERTADTDALSVEELRILGNEYYSKKDYEKALHYYLLAADLEDGTSLGRLGYMYQNGLGVEQDYVTAREYHERASKLGIAASYTNLGYFYQNGLGVEQDYGKAREYYEQAAAGGRSQALWHLGELYFYGYGVAQDYEQAREYFEQAVEKGNADASAKLEEMPNLTASGSCGESANWTLYDSGELFISGTGNMDNWEDPSVTAQNPNPKRPEWENLKDTIQSIVIQEGITSVGMNAFRNYENLISADIAGSANIIDEGAFMMCGSLASVAMAEGIKTIIYEAFYHCTSLTDIEFPDSLTEIDSYAFGQCNGLTSVLIPNGVTAIGDNAFVDCLHLLEISVDSGNNYYTSVDGVLFNKEKTVLMQYPDGKQETTYTIPDGVTEIARRAFQSSALISLTIPNSVSTINQHIILNSSIERLTLPDNLAEIGSHAFCTARNLKSIIIPDTVTKIDEQAFHDCTSLTEVTIPDSVTEIGANAFYGCTALKTVSVPAGLEFPDNAFPIEPVRRT